MAVDVGAVFRITATTQGQAQVDKLTESLKKVGTQGQVSAAQTANAFRMLPAQFTDIATQLAGGQSPFLILLQQGGQIKDQFGGIGNTFRAFASVLTPARLAIGGIGAALGTLAMAYYQSTTAQDNFNKSLALTGNLAGITYDKFKQLSAQVAQRSNMSNGQAEDLLSGAIASSTFGDKSLEPALRAMAAVQKLSGETTDQVVKDFSTMGNGVSKWAADHNRAYNYLTFDQYQYIKALEKAGKVEEAMALNSKLLGDELERRKPHISGLTKLWDDFGNAAKNAWNKVWHAFDDNGPQDILNNNKKRLEELRNTLKNVPTNSPAADKLRLEIGLIENAISATQKKIETDKLASDLRTKEMADELKRIQDEESGLNRRVANAKLDSQIIDAKASGDKRVRNIEMQQQELDSVHARALISERDYIAQSTALQQQKLDAEIAVLRQEAAIERKRPTNDAADDIAKQNRVKQLQEQIADLEGQKAKAAQKGSLDTSVSDQKKSQELQYYIEDLKFANEMLELQARAIEMTDFEFQQLILTKQREHDISVKVRGMTEQEAEAYRKAAEAAGKQAEQIAKANNEKSRSAASGMASAIKSYEEEITNSAKQIERVMSNAFHTIEDSIVDAFTTGKFSFREMIVSILKDMLRMQVQMQIMKPMLDWFKSSTSSSSTGGGSSAGTSAAGSWLASMFGFADGGVMTPGGSMPLRTYAKGGIANSPQLAVFGEGRMNEAYVPLPDGRSIPVTMQGGGGGSVQVNVVVNAQTGETETTGDSDAQLAKLGKNIGQLVRQEIMQQKRPGGLLAA